ncbi:cytochrome P450 [Ganoderma sinense ZZ0214-1]|uniref:Cytochrome P450 n=1 Tax=Ganoderma sinense ZZ0214-1 TaxID=1077348 RepID=A0A2G8S2G9_9APHY|nr:cytochrome P450 [Ganoderma sinense ZZ0214-1]
MDDYKSLVFTLLAAGIATYAVRWYTDPLRAIPTVGGSSLPGLSWLAALSILRDCRAVLEEGYRKYPEQAFKFPALDQWTVVVSGRELVEELRKCGEEELSAPESLKDTFQSKYIFDPLIVADQYHVKVLQEKLTRRLPDLLPDIVDEVTVAVQDHIVSKEDWTSVEVVPVMQNIIARASNRAFVGLPLCRNKEYLRLAVGIIVDTVKTMFVLGLVPRFLKSTVARFYNKVKRNTDLAVQHFRPIIEERQRIAAELGDRWDSKPNDLLQFILDKVKSNNDTISTIAQRVLGMNFAAIHTTSVTVTHALTRLAEQPELLAPLRDEIEKSIAAEGGWTSVALANMWKLDSLLREILRFHGITLVSMGRKAMKDLTLSDGTFLPRGTIVHAATYALHHDSTVLERADTFDAFRFARMRAATAARAKLQFAATTTSPEYLPFGHGAHACPGRYFAENVFKAVLAHLIVNYDMKLGGDGVRPPDVFIAIGVLPSLQSRVVFRPRKRGADAER